MPTTIKSVCNEIERKLCEAPHQDFEAATTVREVQLAFDPKGTKRLTKRQKEALKKLLEIILNKLQ